MILRGLKEVSWSGAKTMMADSQFLKTLLEFDKDGLTEKQVKKVKEYMKDPKFTVSEVKTISTAGAGTHSVSLFWSIPNLRLTQMGLRHGQLQQCG